MPKSLDQSQSKSSKKKNYSVENPWDAAITEAKRKIADLKFSIRVFTERRDKGETWQRGN